VNIQFYEPHAFRTQHKSNRQASNAEELINPSLVHSRGRNLASALISDHHQGSLKLFNQLIEAGVCREQARGVLPQNLYTEYYGTVNLNNLLKFIDLRTHEGAQWEIQKVAEACLEIAEHLWPVAVGAYRRAKNEDR
jgi:thymidylate synthase (FAD)